MTTATTTRPQDLLLNYVADLARDFYPEESDHKRIASAVTIIQSGKMHVNDDGTAFVASRSHDDQVYHVNGACQCYDYHKAHGGRCAHRYAASLAKRLLGYYAGTYYAEMPDGNYGIAFADRGQWIFINEETGRAHAVTLAEIGLGGLVTLAKA